MFLRYHDLLLDRLESLLDLLQIEGGKSRGHALEEVLDVAHQRPLLRTHADELLEPAAPPGVHPPPPVGMGVPPSGRPRRDHLALELPADRWPISDAIPALIAGNAIVLKPAELTPFTALYGVRLLYEAGLPGDLFQVVTGKGSVLGAPLIDQVDFIGFTGSTEVGRKVGEQAGRRLIKSSLELGGKNPMIVLRRCRSRAGRVRAQRTAAYASAGQLCISFERIYVQSGIYDRFLEAFVARTKALKLGPALDYSMDIGSLIGAQPAGQDGGARRGRRGQGRAGAGRRQLPGPTSVRTSSNRRS